MTCPRPRRYVRGTNTEYRWNPVSGSWQVLFPGVFYWQASFAGSDYSFRSDVTKPPRCELLTYASTWAEPEQDPYPGDAT